ncbi:MAG: methyltransferase domain-containing protein [Vicinamibacterales bacterium]
MADEVYTHGHHESVLRSHTWRTAENSAAYLLPHLKPGMSLLDVGCGPGTITIDLARRLSPGRVVGLDRSADVVSQARASAVAANVAIAFQTGDVYALDFSDASFDVVHAHQVLQHLGEPVRALLEMRRVLKPGGVLAVRDSDYASFAWSPSDARLSKWLEVYRAVARRNGGEPDAGRFLKRWALEAGFASVHATSSTWTYADAESCGWWGGLWADRCVKSGLAENAVSYGLATADELQDMANAFREWASKPDAFFMVPHGEVIATKAE